MSFLANSGLFQYVFAFNPELWDASSDNRQRAYAGLRDTWSRTVEGWDAHPQHQAVPGLPDITRDFPADLRHRNDRVLAAAAMMRHPTAVNQAFLLLSGDSVAMVTTICDNEPITDPTAWEGMLRRYQERLKANFFPGLLATARVFFGEQLPNSPDLTDAQWRNAEQAVRVMLGGSASPFYNHRLHPWSHPKHGRFTRPRPTEMNAASSGGQPCDYWLAITPHGASLENDFVLSSDPSQLPRWVRYHLEMAKCRHYETLIGEMCDRFRGERDGLLRDANALSDVIREMAHVRHEDVVDKAWLTTLDVVRRHAALRNDVDELARIAVTLRIGRANQDRLRPREEPGDDLNHNLFDEDRAVATRAGMVADAEKEYWELNTRKLTATMEVLRTALDKRRLDVEREHERSQHRVELRLHLLEVFIVAAYTMEFFHIFHELEVAGLHWYAMLTAFAVAAAVFGYVYHVSGDHDHDPHDNHPRRSGLAILFHRWFSILLLAGMCIACAVTVIPAIRKRLVVPHTGSEASPNHSQGRDGEHGSKPSPHGDADSHDKPAREGDSHDDSTAP